MNRVLSRFNSYKKMIINPFNLTKKYHKTTLYNLHKDLGGEMVEFAGYKLPLYYKTKEGGILNEHHHIRKYKKSNLFDVSHMGQIEIIGKNAEQFLNRLVFSNVSKLQDCQSQYSLLLNEDAGIIDDLIITKNPNNYVDFLQRKSSHLFQGGNNQANYLFLL